MTGSCLRRSRPRALPRSPARSASPRSPGGGLSVTRRSISPASQTWKSACLPSFELSARIVVLPRARHHGARDVGLLGVEIEAAARRVDGADRQHRMVGLQPLDLLDDERAEHLVALAEEASAKQIDLALCRRFPEFPRYEERIGDDGEAAGPAERCGKEGRRGAPRRSEANRPRETAALRPPQARASPAERPHSAPLAGSRAPSAYRPRRHAPCAARPARKEGPGRAARSRAKCPAARPAPRRSRGSPPSPGRRCAAAFHRASWSTIIACSVIV